MKFFDDKCKRTKWYNKNYFFVGTLIIIAINIILYWQYGNDFNNYIGGEHIWYDKFVFDNFFRAILNAFEHANWQHVLLNMLCFLFCGLYIERKTGTFSYLLLMAGLVAISSCFVVTFSISLNWHGASGLVYICYAYILVDYIFSFQKHRRNKLNIIMGAIILALIYLAMCYNGGTDSFGFEWYPYDLMYNAGHYSSFVAGIIVTVMLNLAKLKDRRESVDD